MALRLPQHLLEVPFPLYIIIFSCLAYLCGGYIANVLPALFAAREESKVQGTGLTLDLAEKGSLSKEASLSEDEVFQLEKRAFFSKVSGRYVVWE